MGPNKKSPSIKDTLLSGKLCKENEFSTFDIYEVAEYTERNLEGELDVLNTVLSDTNRDWEKRKESLLRLRCLFNGGIAKTAIFQNQMPTLMRSLSKAVTDLRSQLSRDACVTICHLAYKMGAKRFEPYLANIIKALYTLLMRSKIFVECAGFSILQLLKSCPSSKLIIIFEDYSKSQTSQHRVFTAFFMNEAVKLWDASYIKYTADSFGKAVLSGLNDATGDCRSLARKTYWLYQAICPSEAHGLYEKLDAKKKKELGKENPKKNNNTKKEENEKPRPSIREQIKLKQKQLEHQQHTHLDEDKSSTTNNNNNSKYRDTMKNKTRENTSSVDEDQTVNSANSHTAMKSRNKELGSGGHNNLQKNDRDAAAPSSAANNNNNKLRAQRIGKPDDKNTTTTGMDTTEASSNPNSFNNTSPNMPMRALSKGPRRIAGPQRVCEDENKESTCIGNGNDLGAIDPYESLLLQDAKQCIKVMDAPSSYKEEERKDTFDRLRMLINSPSDTVLPNGLLEKMSDSFIKNINMNLSHKLTVSLFDCLNDFVIWNGTYLSEEVYIRLIYALFKKQCYDTQNISKEKACDVLDKILTVLKGDKVFSVFCQILSRNLLQSRKAKTVLLTFLNESVLQSMGDDDYIQTPATTSAINEVSLLATDVSRAKLGHHAAKCLHTIYIRNGSFLEKVMDGFSSSLKRNVKIMLDKKLNEKKAVVNIDSVPPMVFETSQQPYEDTVKELRHCGGTAMDTEDASIGQENPQSQAEEGIGCENLVQPQAMMNIDQEDNMMEGNLHQVFVLSSNNQRESEKRKQKFIEKFSKGGRWPIYAQSPSKLLRISHPKDLEEPMATIKKSLREVSRCNRGNNDLHNHMQMIKKLLDQNSNSTLHQTEIEANLNHLHKIVRLKSSLESGKDSGHSKDDIMSFWSVHFSEVLALVTGCISSAKFFKNWLFKIVQEMLNNYSELLSSETSVLFLEKLAEAKKVDMNMVSITTNLWLEKADMEIFWKVVNHLYQSKAVLSSSGLENDENGFESENVDPKLNNTQYNNDNLKKTSATKADSDCSLKRCAIDLVLAYVSKNKTNIDCTSLKLFAKNVNKTLCEIDSTTLDSTNVSDKLTSDHQQLRLQGFKIMAAYEKYTGETAPLIERHHSKSSINCDLIKHMHEFV